MRLLAGLAFVLILVTALPLNASAHAALVKSSPARGTTLVQPPQRVELTFSERLEPAYSTVDVVDTAGQQVDLRDASLSPADSRRLTVSLPHLVAGKYTVRFRVLSVDGHVVQSEFAFTVGTRGVAR
ncbi:MAG: hypothetical protein AUH76_14960 [Candidatus Rokubacteria bacterium 13_1_40CM_4_67_11]|nr:MAG: hypothetical protein AUH76_14960 [Candidatus Rokubacteria bacterium 13_1_40CM_4_67_11]